MSACDYINEAFSVNKVSRRGANWARMWPMYIRKLEILLCVVILFCYSFYIFLVCCVNEREDVAILWINYRFMLEILEFVILLEIPPRPLISIVFYQCDYFYPCAHTSPSHHHNQRIDLDPILWNSSTRKFHVNNIHV